MKWEMGIGSIRMTKRKPASSAKPSTTTANTKCVKYVPLPRQAPFAAAAARKARNMAEKNG